MRGPKVALELEHFHTPPNKMEEHVFCNSIIFTLKLRFVSHCLSFVHSPPIRFGTLSKSI